MYLYNIEVGWSKDEHNKKVKKNIEEEISGNKENVLLKVSLLMDHSV
jgi:hypothetical protein